MQVTKKQLLTMIQEAVRQALAEAKFDPKILTHRNMGLVDAINFIEEKVGLRFLGDGSARTVFALDSRKALKMAKNAKGIAQNQTELETATDSPEGLIAKVLQYDPQFKWLVSELVKPITDPAEFKQLTGAEWNVFSYLVADPTSNWKNHLVSAVYKENMTVEEAANNPFINKTMNYLMKLKNPLISGDLTRLDHWGKTSDQRVVLLDYGFTMDVWEKHYDPSIINADTDIA